MYSIAHQTQKTLKNESLCKLGCLLGFRDTEGRSGHNLCDRICEHETLFDYCIWFFLSHIDDPCVKS